MDQALSIAPSDYWRWHLIANAPEGSDAGFTFEDFQARINSDLANVLGNFVNRITKYAVGKFEGKVPSGGEWGEAEDWIVAELATRIPQLIEYHENMEFRKAASETRAIWAAGNEYLTQAAPWTHYKTNVDQAAMGTRIGLNLVALFGILAQPIVPDAADKILEALSIPDDRRSWKFGEVNVNWEDVVKGILGALPEGHTISAPDVLFTKIEDSEIAEWAERFGGAN